jgi:hypothetical protein
LAGKRSLPTAAVRLFQQTFIFLMRKYSAHIVLLSVILQL